MHSHQTLDFTLPVATEITPSSRFLVDPSDFTMSLYVPYSAPDQLPEPNNADVYIEEWPDMKVRGITWHIVEIYNVRNLLYA